MQGAALDKRQKLASVLGSRHWCAELNGHIRFIGAVAVPRPNFQDWARRACTGHSVHASMAQAHSFWKANHTNGIHVCRQAKCKCQRLLRSWMHIPLFSRLPYRGNGRVAASPETQVPTVSTAIHMTAGSLPAWLLLLLNDI